MMDNNDLGRGADGDQALVNQAATHLGPSGFDPSRVFAEMESARRFLLLASYCGNDNPNCSESRPCNDCLATCNVFRLEGGEIVFDRELGEPMRNRRGRIGK